jgi:hypothetical protein
LLKESAMHRISILSVVLAACLVSAVAIAAKDKATASFEPLSASGIKGSADLQSMQSGETRIHGSLRGLTPGTEYVSRAYKGNQTCSTGGENVEVARFVANPAGVVTFNAKVPAALADIGSISVQIASDNALQACASVTS